MKRHRTRQGAAINGCSYSYIVVLALVCRRWSCVCCYSCLSVCLYPSAILNHLPGVVAILLLVPFLSRPAQSLLLSFVNKTNLQSTDCHHNEVLSARLYCCRSHYRLGRHRHHARLCRPGRAQGRRRLLLWRHNTARLRVSTCSPWRIYKSVY